MYRFLVDWSVGLLVCWSVCSVVRRAAQLVGCLAELSSGLVGRMCCYVGWSVCRLACRSVVDWLIDLIEKWSVLGWLVDYVKSGLVGWLVDRLVGQLLASWLVG